MGLLLLLFAVWYGHWDPKRQVQALVTMSYFARFQLISGMMLVVYEVGYHLRISDGGGGDAAIIETFIVVGSDFWLFMGCCCLAMVVLQYQLYHARQLCGCTVASEREPSGPLFVCVLFGLFLTCGLIIVGILFPSYILEFKGLGGYILSLVGVSPDRTYSMIETASQLRDGWLDPSSGGAFALQISWTLIAIALPCAQMLACFWAWIWPGKWSYFTLESCTIWASLDVFVVAILASVLALTEYTSFMVGASCNSINAWLSKYAPNALDEPKCIDLTSRLLMGVYILLVGMVFMAFMSRFILNRLKRNGWDKDERTLLREGSDTLIN